MKILLTGGNRSTGKCVADHLRRGRRNEVVTLSDSNDADVEMDLRDMTEDRAAMAILKTGPDALINLAGITRLDTIQDLTQLDWNEVLRVNLTAPWLLSQAFVRYSQVGGIIVNVISMAHRTPLRHSAAYNASKAGLVGLTKQMAKELGDGWKIVGVCPNTIEGSDMVVDILRDMQRIRGMTAEEADKYNSEAGPLMRRQPMEEVAQMVAMALDVPQFMTGSLLEAPGGAG